MVTASVRGCVSDDITQCQDDEGSVRNCGNLYIFTFLCKSLGKVTSTVFFRRGFRRKVPFVGSVREHPAA